MSVEFEIHRKEYSAEGFYEQYKDRLPQMIMVTQGYMGEVCMETFGRGQVIRIHTYSKQRRVLAQVSDEKDMHGLHSLQGKNISLPADCDCKFNVIKHGKITNSRPAVLRDMRHNTLPLEVRFVNSHDQVTVLGGSVQDYFLLTLIVFDVYDDIYLLGNPLCDEKLYKTVTAVPVYLPDLKFAIVKSIKGYTYEDYQSFLHKTDVFVRENVKFDQTFGNEGVAIYSNNVSTEGKTYTFITPSKLLHKERTKLQQASVRQMENMADGFQDSTLRTVSERCDTYDVIHEEEHKKPLRLQLNQMAASRFSDAASHISQRVNKPAMTEVPRKDPVVMPVRPNAAKISETRRPLPEQFTGSIESSDGAINVELLTVEDVCDWLKKLKLERYVDVFLENQVDGTLLKDMNERILKEDFGMKDFDILKLTKFAKFGYFPKTRGSDC